MLKWVEEFVETHGRLPSVGRNEACPCGKGRKFKRCCLAAFDSDLREARFAAAVAADNASDPPAGRAGVASRALGRANRYRTPK
jgi:SEC-C motif